MTGEEFTAFLERMGWNNITAAAELGIGRNTVARYKETGAGDDIDYACAAIAFGLRKWSEGESDRVAVSRADLTRLSELVVALTGQNGA